MIKKVLLAVSLLAICFSIMNFDKPTYYHDDSTSDGEMRTTFEFEIAQEDVKHDNNPTEEKDVSLNV